MKNRLIKNKSAISIRLVVQSIILVAILTSLIFIFNQLRVKSEKAATETECIASIEAHAAVVESQLVKTEIVDMSTAGIGSLFIDTTADPPPIKCDTKLIKSKSKTKEKMEEEIISSVVKNWFLFKEGKKAFYPGLEKKNFCFVAEVIEFPKIPEVELYGASQRMTVRQIIKTYNGPESVLEYFDESWKTNDHIFERNYDSTYKNFLAYYQVYYLGNPKWFFDKVAEFENQNYLEGRLEAIKDLFGSSFSAAVDMQGIFGTFFDNLDSNSFFDPPTSNVPYAVIFFQTHDYPSNVANLAGDEYYPAVFSAIMVLPYTEDAMSQVQCKYMPVESQN